MTITQQKKIRVIRDFVKHLFLIVALFLLRQNFLLLIFKTIGIKLNKIHTSIVLHEFSDENKKEIVDRN